MQVRLKDIALDLGVSIATVSKALRDHPDLAVETRDRVLRRIKELNYRPNLMARSLVTGRSSLVGLVVPDLIHPFFGEIAKSLSAALRQQNFFLIVASSDTDPALEEAEIENMLAHRLDALVVASCQPGPGSLRDLRDSGPPLILLDRQFPGFPCHFVGGNDIKVGELAAEHLVDRGGRRIAHIRGPENSVGQRRLEGFAAALARHGHSLPPEYIVTAAGASESESRSKGFTAMQHLLALSDPPDAVFAFNDAIAIGAMSAALEAGKQLPQDLALIGCGNFHYDDMLRVPLSSISQSVDEIGGRIARMIFSLLEAKAAEANSKAEGPPANSRPRRVLLEPLLVARDSTGGR
jgi:LacI family transcriptional regulator